MKIDKTLLSTTNEMLKVQGNNGNWDYDPYMHGLYNGMEFMVALLENRIPNFREAPKVWLIDIKEDPNNPIKPIKENKNE